jgi:predicted nucleic acid-binding protein
MSQDFIVDTSVVMTWCFDDECNQYADAVLEGLQSATGYVPAIWPLEIANVLLLAERRNRLGEADSARFIALLSHLPLVVEPESPGSMLKEVMPLARQNQLSTYAASYLALAMRKGLPIATQDRELRKAARRNRVQLI